VCPSDHGGYFFNMTARSTQATVAARRPPPAARSPRRRAASAAHPPRSAGARRPSPAGPRAACARQPPRRAACPAAPPAACATAACAQLERQLAAAGERLQRAKGQLSTLRDDAAEAQRAADGALATAAAARAQLEGQQVLSETCLAAARMGRVAVSSIGWLIQAVTHVIEHTFSHSMRHLFMCFTAYMSGAECAS